MPFAMTFNAVNSAMLGGTALNRIYCGPTLVWSRGVGLPYTDSTFPNGSWTARLGTWKSYVQNGNYYGASATGSASTYSGINAANVRISATVRAEGATGWAGLWARVSADGQTYYSGEYCDDSDHVFNGIAVPRTFLRIAKVVGGVRTVLGTWYQSDRPIKTGLVFSVTGPTLTVTRGSVSQTVTDSSITSPGGIGLIAVNQDSGFYYPPAVTVTAT